LSAAYLQPCEVQQNRTRKTLDALDMAVPTSATPVHPSFGLCSGPSAIAVRRSFSVRRLTVPYHKLKNGRTAMPPDDIIVALLIGLALGVVGGGLIIAMWVFG
jgi:hypothetical protein